MTNTETQNVPITNTKADLSATLSSPLKPFTYPGFFKGVIGLYYQNFKVLFSAVLLVYSPVIVAGICSKSLLYLQIFQSSQFYMLTWLMGKPFTLLAGYMAPAILALMVSNQLSDKDVDLWESLDLVWQRIYAVATGGLAAGFSVGVTALFFFLPFFYEGTYHHQLSALLISITTFLGLTLTSFLYAATALTPVIAVIENKSGFSAVKRSISLTCKKAKSFTRYYFFYFGSLIILWILSYVAMAMGAVLTLPFTSSLNSGIAYEAIYFLSTLAFGPAAFALPAYLYFDQRRKFENFSIEQIEEKKL